MQNPFSSMVCSLIVAGCGFAAGAARAGNSPPAQSAAAPAAPAQTASVPSAQSASGSTVAKPEIAATIKQALESRFPGVKVDEVRPSAIAGLYEVAVGDDVVYTDPNADYVVTGAMVDTRSKRNLTNDRRSARGAIDYSTLPFDRAIKIVKGNGKRQLAVFSDPDCPYCQQLEKSLVSVQDITIFIFLFPIASLHPQAPAHARAIWCSKDRPLAWKEWMLERKVPQATCTGDPVDELQKLGDKLHINSTPTMYLADGRRVMGALPAPELEKLLAEKSPRESGSRTD